MFQKAELARLQAEKELLLLESRANRLLLAAEWQQLRSPKQWRDEAARVVRQHPIFSATLAAAAGLLAVKALRKPGAVAGGVGRLGKLASLAFTVWKIVRTKKSEE